MKVLIVDDNTTDRIILRSTLEKYGHEVTEALNGRDGIRLAIDSKPDIIVSDILMPVMDGFQLCNECKKDHSLREVPFVLYTSTYSDGKDEILAGKMGVDRFLVKPIETERFIDNILNIIADAENGNIRLNPPKTENIEDVYKLYNERLIKQMEKKSLELEFALKERETAEKTCRESEERYKCLFKNANDAIYLIDPVTTLFFKSNKKAAVMTGYTDRELAKMTALDLHPESERNIVQQMIEQVLAKGSASNVSGVHHRRKDGRLVPIEISSSMITIKGKVFNMSIVRDVTERKAIDQQREQLNTKLEQKNKELEQLIFVTSHDLRTPLVNIEGFSNELGASASKLIKAIQDRRVPDDIKKKAVSIIENDIPEAQKFISKSIIRMHSLLSGLLKLSRLGRAELNIEILDMNELMSDVLSILQTQIKKAGARVKMTDLPPCRADEKQVNHVFSNILSNAVKFLDPGRKGNIEVSGYHDNNRTVYCVKDNGRGIAPEYQDRIFDMFHRLEPSKNDGEGLGLNIAQRALERNRGEIWLKSKPGRGSSFYVSIPPAVM